MSKSASSASKYDILSITKDDKEINLQGKTTSFNYYESLLSPNITATMTFMDTGGAVKYKKEYDNQERLASVYNGLPITGGEKVKFKIKSKLGTLDFSTDEKALLVNSASNPDQQSQREVVVLSLFSQAAKTNQESVVYEKRQGNIGDTVTQLVKQHLKIDKIDSDKTRNGYPFIGNSNNVFEVILWLASKSIPENGLAGYFFYETRDGFKFKAIDNLIDQEAVNKGNPYIKTAVLKSNQDNNENDYKILASTIKKNQSLINALKSGAYIVRNIYFNPYNFKETEVEIPLDGKKEEKSEKVLTGSKKDTVKLEKKLGKEVPLPDVKKFTRTHYDILDIGTLTPSGKGEGAIENNPEDFQAQSTIRYNNLFRQVLSVQIPCNPNLKAGDVIQCDFEIVTQDKKSVGATDPVQSGSYLIVDLCHHFSSNRSITSMTLVRDTYGKRKES